MAAPQMWYHLKVLNILFKENKRRTKLSMPIRVGGMALPPLLSI